ncbi:MAG: capsular biosynthesis protein [Thiobacillus sp.]|nr:capsular biosynthesis protein [Thiobacillus sp.]
MIDKAKKSLLFWIVIAPMLLAALYFSVFAAERYVSESVVTVRQSGEVASALSGLGGLLGGLNSPSREETLYLQQYVLSLDMLRHLDAKLGLRKAYESEQMDFIYRLYGGTSQEWFLRYYRNRVAVHFDEVNGLLTVSVQAFDPALAQAANAEILGQSERFVNEISHRLAREQLAFAEAELRKASERLREAKNRLLAFQNKYGVFDPMAQAQAAASLGGQLDAEVARKEAELKAMLAFMQDTAPAVISLRNEIGALKAQREIEQQKVASGKGDRLNRLASEFHNLSLEAGFAEESYKAALAAVESTRIEASRKIKNLVVIESPAKPETALYPMRLYDLATLLVGLFLLYGIVLLVIATIQDHRD